MLSSLLDRLTPERRHLAFLVGVLTLMFVLTAALAVKAHRSDTARHQQATAALHDLVDGAAADWGLYIGQFTYESLGLTYRGGLRELMADAGTPLAELAALARPQDFCPSCVDHPIHFSIDLQTGVSEQLPAAGLSAEQIGQIAAWAGTGRQALMRDSVYAGVLALPGEVPVAVAGYVRLGAGGVPIRATGYTLSLDGLTVALSNVFSAMRLLPPTAGRAVTPERVITAWLSNDAGVLGAAPPVTSDIRSAHVLEDGPLGGLWLQVALLPGAEQLLLMGGTASDLPLLAGLMLAITILLGMALLLVRREAELVRLRADFVSGVSHELRTPLAQIRMFTETLLLGRVRSDVERRRSLEIIDQEARRLTRLVENVLLFSKSQGGRVTPLAPEPTRVAAEIRSAVESFAPMCRKRSVDVRLELQEDITAPVDRGALRQILVNLLENALKYGPAGQRITVGAALFDVTARVWVDDEGPGIPSTERERVFDSFYRIAQPEGEERRSGSGIGLSVVRELARLHGGTVRAEEAPGGGARLLVELPGAHATPSEAGLAAAS